MNKKQTLLKTAPGLLLFIYALTCRPIPIFSDENAVQPGFGLQPGIIQPQSDPKTLTKRIMSSTRYKLTPGDSYEFVVKIEETERYPLLLSDDYLLDIPFLGTINVEGMYFSDLKKLIVQRVKARVPVQFVDFALTSPALFDVFIYGGVNNPGIATVNPLSRVSEAILLAKGLVPGASFRRVELIRRDETTVLDLARFTARADLSQNPLLEPEDKIYVPQAQKIVEIRGKIKYPEHYELVPGETLGNLLKIAGGITPEAKIDTIRISRLEEEGRLRVLNVALDEAEGFELKNGDRISIGSRLENTERIVVDAAVFGTPTSGDKPAQIPTQNVKVDLPYVEGLTLLKLLSQMGGPTPLAETGKSYIQRGENGERIDVDVKELWKTRDPIYDIALRPRDLLVIPMKKLQVVVAGEVNSPGPVPFANGYKVYDYILAAGGVNVETGDKNSLFFVDEMGNRKRTGLESDVEPGSLIYVGKNNWTITTDVLADILIVTGFVGALIVLTNAIIDLVQEF